MLATQLLLARPLPNGKGLYLFKKPLPNIGKGFLYLLKIILKGEGLKMKKLKTSIIELIKKNKEEIMKDREKLEKIEKRIEDKYSKG